MQQTQQTLPSVRHKLPQPNSILQSQLIKSQPAHHIRKRVHDIHSSSSHNWPLDRSEQSCRDQIAAILSSYYGPNYDINELLNAENKIVFLNPLVHPTEHYEDQNYYFGSILTCTQKPRKSMPNPLVRQTTYQLQFDDKIQSGNLYFALQHQPQTYLLANRLDYNTRSYGQWFYFKVTNVTKKSENFKFYIINMTKNGTMFGKGLKISVCRKGVWGKQGTNIEYIPNKFLRKNIQSQNLDKGNTFVVSQTYYTLAFNLEIASHQSIFVAYNEPYTYTKLGKKLDEICHGNPNLNRSIICRTPLGNRIQMITITKKISLKEKKIIFITARAHPIETAGSYVVEGILEQLTKPILSANIEELLENYIIKIVPMINPDGVIVGNSRCNMHGFDLNRQWKNPTQSTAPQILCLKRAILKYQGRIQMFLDLHGHSKKKSVFAYGCHDIKNPIASREFPYLLSKFSQKDFDYSECRFSMLTQAKNNGKDGTARVSLWNRLKIPNIFTIQNSYCCAQGSQFHYDSKSYANIGKDIVNTLCQYFKREQPQQKLSGENLKTQKQNLTKSLSQITIKKEQILHSLRTDEKLYSMNIKNQSQASSDSEPQERIQTKEKKDTAFKNKLYRNKSNHAYMKPRSQSVANQKNSLARNNQAKVIQRTTTMGQRSSNSKDKQLIHSASNLQLRIKKKLFKNLSPINKVALPLKKCQGVETKQDIHTTVGYRGQSQPLLQKQKYPKIRKNNAISIIEIGLDHRADESRENQQILKALSAKHIRGDYGIFSKLHTIDTSKSGSKLNSFLKQITPPQIQSFSDYHQFRQPVLKAKKNIIKSSTKIQDLVNRINYLNKNNIFETKKKLATIISNEGSMLNN